MLKNKKRVTQAERHEVTRIQAIGSLVGGILGLGVIIIVVAGGLLAYVHYFWGKEIAGIALIVLATVALVWIAGEMRDKAQVKDRDAMVSAISQFGSVFAESGKQAARTQGYRDRLDYRVSTAGQVSAQKEEVARQKQIEAAGEWEVDYDFEEELKIVDVR